MRFYSTMRHLTPPRPPIGLAIAAALAISAQAAWACPVPVFQYSLEHWSADRYRVIVHHADDLTDSQQAALELLRETEAGEPRAANLTVIADGAAPPDGDGGAAGDAPRIEVRYPAISGLDRTVWSGALSSETVEGVVNSPVRRKVAEHLINRRAAVWVLLESGDRRKDRAARDTLDYELARLERTLVVDNPDPMEIGADFGQIHTDVEFAVLTLSRDDPAEQPFIRMLLAVEPDLHEFDDEPIAFPIYGRGMVMYALIGRGINRSTLTAVGEFLTGPTTGEVKSSNPGVDLLMAVDWDAHVERLTDPGVHGPAGAEGFLDRMEHAEERLDE